MSTPVQPIPEGFHSVTPYLAISGAADALEFYKKAFNAQERFRMPGADGKTIGHAEMIIGNSIIMLADEFPECGNVSPKTLKGSPVGFALYVEDADAMFHQAVAAGATVFEELTDKFYGDRSGTVVDPFGYKWSLMTHQEDVSPEEIDRRFKAEHAKHEAGK
jgi:PhnB protein